MGSLSIHQHNIIIHMFAYAAYTPLPLANTLLMFAKKERKKKWNNIDDDYESRASNDNHNVMLLVMLKLCYNKHSNIQSCSPLTSPFFMLHCCCLLDIRCNLNLCWLKKCFQHNFTPPSPIPPGNLLQHNKNSKIWEVNF